MLTNVPRPDNLHSIERTLLAWTEIILGGMPAALHVNARTNHDYENWTAFIQRRTEIEAIAFEFATGCRYRDRIDWHVGRLRDLAVAVGRPLSIIVREGTQKIGELAKSCASVTLVDTEPFGRTIRRRRGYITEGEKIRWATIRTPAGAPLDGLLVDNIAIARAARLTQYG